MVRKLTTKQKKIEAGKPRNRITMSKRGFEEAEEEEVSKNVPTNKALYNSNKGRS